MENVKSDRVYVIGSTTTPSPLSSTPLKAETGTESTTTTSARSLTFGANYRPAEKRQQVRRSTGFNNPGHIAPAFGALAHQQQRTTLDHTGEVLDGDRVPATDTPNIGQQ